MAHIGRMIAIALALTSCQAVAKDASRYPCNVFSTDMCFRINSKMHVDYSVPADFSTYQVLKDSTLIATVYLGSAPDSQENSSQTRSVHTSIGSIKIISSDSAMDFYIDLKDDGRKIHISASTDPAIRAEALEFLSSIRPCNPIGTGGQSCPVNNAWGKYLTTELGDAK